MNIRTSKTLEPSFALKPCLHILSICASPSLPVEMPGEIRLQKWRADRQSTGASHYGSYLQTLIKLNSEDSNIPLGRTLPHALRPRRVLKSLVPSRKRSRDTLWRQLPNDSTAVSAATVLG